VLDQMAKEKFKLRGKERLPLETMEGRFSLMDFLGMNAKVFAPIKAPADMAAQMVPLSLRYPNQPLWVME
jgi:hypothetical protein